MPEWLTRATPARLTQALLVINAAVFAAMVARGISPIDPGVEQMLRWGADYGPLTLGGQWWRVLTSNYLHFGVIHLALNMWCLWNLGNVAERIFGRWPFAAAYTLCGLAGSAVSLLWRPDRVSAGASGAVFGVAGLLLAAFYLKKLPAPSHFIQNNLKSVGTFVLYNVVIGAASHYIDNSAHLGGLAMGLVLGALLPDQLSSRTEHMPITAIPGGEASPGRSGMPVFALGALAVIGGLYGAQYVHRHAVQLQEAETLLQAKQYEGAIKIATSVTAEKPDLVQAHVFLGRACIEAKKYDAAYAALKKAVTLDERDVDAWFRLGVAAIHLDRNEEAAQIYERVARAWPNSWEASYNLALTYRNLGRYPEAITTMRRVAQLAPSEPDVHEHLAIFYLRENQPDAALASINKAIALNPNHAGAYTTLGRAYQAKKMQKEANAAYEKAVELAAKNQKQDSKE